MPKGIDKGYDVFIEVAKLLVDIPNIFFHVVGTFNETDIDIISLKNKIKFYGSQKPDFFLEFYSKMDIILSPNIPFMLLPGAFDGFPTGCCTEAGLCKVAVFCTDILNQNIFLKDGEEIVLIAKNTKEIYNEIIMYYNDPIRLYSLAHKGYEKLKNIFDIDQQTQPRLKILNDFVNINYEC